MATFSEKTPPPFNAKHDNYEKWKRKLSLWESITDVDKKKRGSLIIVRLDEDTQDSIWESVEDADIKSDTGAQHVTNHMDKLFKRDDTLSAYEDYEAFETYQRPAGMSIVAYCREFERKLKKVQTAGTTLGDHILSYRLLKSARLTASQLELLRATAKDMSYKEVTTQLKKTFKSEDKDCGGDVKVKEEPEDSIIDSVEYVEQDTLFGRSSRNYNNDKWSSRKSDKGRGKSWQGRGANSQSGADNKESKGQKKRGKNPLDQYGRVTRCIHCESINHWIKDCPDVSEKEQKTYISFECEDHELDS